MPRLTRHQQDEQTRAQERARIARHLDALAARILPGNPGHREITQLADQVRANTLPTIVDTEPGPDVTVLLTPHGDRVTRTTGGWIWWGGRSGSRPVWTWEQVREFGPLTLPPETGETP